MGLPGFLCPANTLTSGEYFNLLFSTQNSGKVKANKINKTDDFLVFKMGICMGKLTSPDFLDKRGINTSSVQASS